MGVATSSSIIASYGLAVGMIPTYNALLGASATILLPDAMIEKMKMAPLFDWFFGKRLLKDKSLRTRARIVAMKSTRKWVATCRQPSC
jgi:hypothetical protein